MNITFLVGNGFDIAAGLHTGYNSFYNYFCKTTEDEEENPTLKKLKENIHEYVKSACKEKNDREEMGESEEEKLKKARWADFELGLGEFTQQITKEEENDFILCREKAVAKLIEYLKLEQVGFNVGNLAEQDIERIRSQLGYFYSELLPSERELIERVFQSVQNQKTTIRFISFNYTTVLDAIVDKISKEPIRTWKYGTSNYTYQIDSQVLHVHGRLDEFPILAVHDESQIKNKDMLSKVGFKETMIKSAGVEAMGRDWYKKAEQMIDNSRIICIYGMSLGATDKKWWARIADWLSRSSSNLLLIFQHLESEISSISIGQYVTNKNLVIERFLSYSNLSEEKKAFLRKRIFVTFNAKNVLQIKDKEKEGLTV